MCAGLLVGGGLLGYLVSEAIFVGENSGAAGLWVGAAMVVCWLVVLPLAEYISTLSYVRSGSSASSIFVVMGLATLVIGTAELLPTRCRKVFAVLRITGALLVFLAIWLFVA